MQDEGRGTRDERRDGARIERLSTLDSRLSTLFVCLASVLVAIGTVMAYSASMTSRATDKDEIHLARHAAYLATGIVAATVAASIPSRVWLRYAPWLFAGTVVLLVMVLVPGIGTSVNGSRRWLRVGPISVQPSEIAKLTLPLLVARLAVLRRKELERSSNTSLSLGKGAGGEGIRLVSDYRLRSSLGDGDAVQDKVMRQDIPSPLSPLSREGTGFVRSFQARSGFVGTLLINWVGGTVLILWPAGIILPLVLLEPDLGTTLFLAAGTALLLFLAGWPLRNFLLGIAAAVPALVALIFVQPYQLRRITGFIAAWNDLSTAPYQVRQGLITLGSGGLYGTGLGKGWQKLSFLPEANTDFVFAVIGEELGLVGTLGVLALWCAIFVVGLQMLSGVRKRRFAVLCGITLLVQLVGQALVNMAVVTALLPPKGIALPLVSYGGSNLVTSLVAIGMILSFSRTTETT